MVHTVSHTQHLLCVCAVHIVYVHCAMRTRSKVTIVQYSCTVVWMSIVCTLKDGELGVYCSWRGLQELGCLLYYTMDIERARVIIMCIMYVYLSV